MKLTIQLITIITLLFQKLMISENVCIKKTTDLPKIQSTNEPIDSLTTEASVITLSTSTITTTTTTSITTTTTTESTTTTAITTTTTLPVLLAGKNDFYFF
jgi:hypothetical protein